MAYTTRFGKLVRLHNRMNTIIRNHHVEQPKAMPSDKGELGGSCNRSACLAPGARWFNHSTRRHYCDDCAWELNNDRFNRRDALELYGHDLCTLVDDRAAAQGTGDL